MHDHDDEYDASDESHARSLLRALGCWPLRKSMSLVGWLVIEAEQLFSVLKQWRTAVPVRALSRTNHLNAAPAFRVVQTLEMICAHNYKLPQWKTSAKEILKPNRWIYFWEHNHWYIHLLTFLNAEMTHVLENRTGQDPWLLIMMTSSNGNIFRDTGPLCEEFTGHRWIPRTEASDAELWCFLWSAPE